MCLLGGLARYSVHLTATALLKLFHHFLYLLDPLGSKKPKRSKLSNGVGCLLFYFAFHIEKIMFVLKKYVNTMAFLGAVKFNRPSSHEMLV